MGFCLGGVGFGDCGPENEQKLNIVNTAIASAYYSNAFNCRSTVDGGNTVVADGVCNCADLGILNTQDCNTYQAQTNAYNAFICQEILKSRPDMPPELVACLCRGGGGCNINVDQNSLLTSQMVCNQATDVQRNLDQNFAEDVRSKVENIASDIGALFDQSKNKAILDIATSMKAHIDSQMITDIAKHVVVENTVKAGCKGLNYGITQFSQYDGILQVMLQNRDIGTLKQQLDQTVDAAVTNKQKGLGGLLDIFGNMGIIGLVVVIIIVGLVLWYMFKKSQNTNETTRAMNVERTYDGNKGLLLSERGLRH
jgi:hypothetical protein